MPPVPALTTTGRRRRAASQAYLLHDHSMKRIALRDRNALVSAAQMIRRQRFWSFGVVPDTLCLAAVTTDGHGADGSGLASRDGGCADVEGRLGYDQPRQSPEHTSNNHSARIIDRLPRVARRTDAAAMSEPLVCFTGRCHHAPSLTRPAATRSALWHLW